MRPNNNQRRPRGRNGGGGGNSGGGGGGGNKNKPQRNQTYDSNGPEVRVRGNAHQIFEKYQVLAREATAAGDRIAAESYFQHAEHYLRLINASGGFQQRGPGPWADSDTPEEGDGRGENRADPRGGDNRGNEARSGENRGGDARGEGRSSGVNGNHPGGQNGYGGREERGGHPRDRRPGAGEIDPEGEQPELPATAFGQGDPT